MMFDSALNLMPPVSSGLVAALAAGAALAYLLLRWWFGRAADGSRRWKLAAIRVMALLTLLAILANPVWVRRSPAVIVRPRVVCLLDTSQSMAFGATETRIEQAVEMVGQVERRLSSSAGPELSYYSFGRTLTAVESLRTAAGRPAVSPTDTDTQLLSALRQLTSRFSQPRPKAVVLFSDGRARNPVGLEEMARRYKRMNVAIHTVPLGNPAAGGDVAIVNMVVPTRVRKHAQAEARIWLRSYGYDGQRAELRLATVGKDLVRLPLASLPITLKSGIQSFNLSFQSDLQSMRVEASVPPQPDEVSSENNAVAVDISVDRTKIRVLYVEGSTEPSVQRIVAGRPQTIGPFSYLAEALLRRPRHRVLGAACPAGTRAIAAGRQLILPAYFRRRRSSCSPTTPCCSAIAPAIASATRRWSGSSGGWPSTAQDSAWSAGPAAMPWAAGPGAAWPTCCR